MGTPIQDDMSSCDTESIATLRADDASSIISEVNSEIKYGGKKVESVLDIWPLGGVECLNKVAPQWSDEPLVYIKPEPFRLEGISDRLDGYTQFQHQDPEGGKHKVDPFLEKVGLKNPIRREFRDTRESQNRAAKIEKALREVKRIEMNDLRSDCHTLLVIEKAMYPEANARGRMSRAVVAQCMKMTDLFEEACQILDVLDEKDLEEQQINDVLKAKEDKRFGLEAENEILRKEIWALQDQLHNVKLETQAKVNKDMELNGTLRKEKDDGNRMIKTAEAAKGKMTVLRNAMHTAEKSMEASISDIQAE